MNSVAIRTIGEKKFPKMTKSIISNNAIKKFVKYFIRSAKNQGVTDEMEYDAVKNEIVIKGECKGKLSLDVIYPMYKNALKSNRPAIISRFINAIKEAGSLKPAKISMNYENEKEKLVPLVRNRFLIENAHLTNFVRTQKLKENEFSGFHEIISDDATLMFGYDLGYGTMPLSKEILKKWNVPFSDIMEQAKKNLLNTTSDSFVEIAPGVFRGNWSDSYDSSRILFPEVVQRLNLKSEPVMMVPSRNCFIVTSSENVAGQWALLDIAQNEIEKNGLSSFVSLNMYKYSDGIAVEYMSTNIMVLNRQAEMKMMVVDSAYEEQQRHLRQLHTDLGIDVFVASYLIVEDEVTNKRFSACAWAQGIKQIIPKTDIVMMYPPFNDEITNIELAVQKTTPKPIKWDDVAEILGVNMIKIDGYPARYEVSGFPSKEQFDLLKPMLTPKVK